MITFFKSGRMTVRKPGILNLALMYANPGLSVAL